MQVQRAERADASSQSSVSADMPSDKQRAIVSYANYKVDKNQYACVFHAMKRIEFESVITNVHSLSFVGETRFRWTIETVQLTIEHLKAIEAHIVAGHLVDAAVAETIHRTMAIGQAIRVPIG